VIGVVDAHAQKSRAHQPPGRRVPQGMRHDPARELGQSNSRLKRGLNSLNWSAVPFDEVLARDPLGLPTAQMIKELRWNRHGGLTLLGCASTDRQAIKNSLFQIDE
jgi:hypothetical protein